MNDWYLRHISKQLYQVVNGTGEAAKNVSMHVTGAVVPAFQFSAESVPSGDGPEQVFAQAWGEPGRVVISWTDGSGALREVQIPVR